MVRSARDIGDGAHASNGGGPRSTVNFLSDEGKAGLEAAYGAATLKQLVALKDQFDPTNVFRFNANIPPSASA